MPALTLDRVSYDRVVKYAKRTGQPVSAVASKAISYWWETQGEVYFEAMKRPRPPAQVLAFPSPFQSKGVALEPTPE